MKEETFNKWFSVFILGGMTIALILATVLKFETSGAARWMLLISAFGSLMGVLSTVCSANGWIITFLFGFIDVAIYGAMCLVSWRQGNAGLGNAILHFVYFVPMQFIGFAQWKKRGAGAQSKVRARRLSGKQWAVTTAAFIAGSILAYFILARFDRSAAQTFIKWAVVLDVLPLACNIVGQLLMSTAYMDQWFFWIGVNVTSICMWSATLASSPDSSYAVIYIIKYSFYLLNSFNGLRIWLGLSKEDPVLDM
jgi:nicotinamide mononucleotide transporter